MLSSRTIISLGPVLYVINYQGSKIQAARNQLEEIKMASLILGPSILSIKHRTNKKKKKNSSSPFIIINRYYSHVSTRNPEEIMATAVEF